MKTNRLTRLSVFTAVALIIHTAETFIPLPLPLPGIKLGLANTVTIFMLFMPPADGQTLRSRTVDVFAVLTGRIILSAFISGRLIILAYSLTGGLLAITVQLAIRRIVSDRQAWVCGAAGAMFHNTGQILAAIVITGTPSVIGYLPILIITGIITGTLTGLAAGFAADRLRGRPISDSK